MNTYCVVFLLVIATAAVSHQNAVSDPALGFDDELALFPVSDLTKRSIADEGVSNDTPGGHKKVSNDNHGGHKKVSSDNHGGHKKVSNDNHGGHKKVRNHNHDGHKKVRNNNHGGHKKVSNDNLDRHKKVTNDNPGGNEALLRSRRSLGILAGIRDRLVRDLKLEFLRIVDIIKKWIDSRIANENSIFDLLSYASEMNSRYFKDIADIAADALDEIAQTLLDLGREFANRLRDFIFNVPPSQKRPVYRTIGFTYD